jgi:sulfate permease, SulP family
VLVLDLDAVPDIDVTALDRLVGFDRDLRQRGITLWLATLNARPLDMLRRLPDADAWERRLFRELDAAATAFGASRSSPSGSRRQPDWGRRAGVPGSPAPGSEITPFR